MSLPLHEVFLAYLLLALAWNLHAWRARGAADEDGGGPPRDRLGALVLLLQVVATAALVRDRLVLPAPAWLAQPALAWLLVASHGLALVRNLSVARRRGPQPTDLAFVAHSVFMLVVLGAAAAALGGAQPGHGLGAALHAHSVVQLLLGTPLAQTWTLSWHVPLLSRRARPAGIPAMTLGLAPAALAAFLVIIPVAFWSSSARVLASFEAEPTLAAPLPPTLSVGVLDWDPGRGPSPPGDLTVWVLPYDHPGTGLPELPPERDLVVELRPPDAWWRSLPSAEERAATLLNGAERLAGLLRPGLLLPVAEPDGETSLAFPPDYAAEDWLALLQQARGRIQAVNPDTLLGVRLAGRGERSRELFERLAQAALVDVIGPRLAPGGSHAGGARAADDTLVAVLDWWRALPAARRPDLWLMAVGCSPLAFGERAQARFVEGQLARAAAAPEVSGVLIDGWRDRGATRGLLRPDGAPRLAGARLRELLAGR